MANMTKRRLRFDAESLGTELPIGGTIILWLLLDRLHAAGWFVGVVWTLWGFFCLTYVYGVVMDFRGDFISAKEIDARLRKLEGRPPR